MKGIIKRSTASKRKIAAIFLTALMLVNLFSGAAVNSEPTMVEETNPTVVTVCLDGIETSYETTASTVEELLAQNNIVLKDNDYINVNFEDKVTNGMYIEIKIAKYITVHDEGKSYASVTYKTTVSDVLTEFYAPLSNADGCYPEREYRVYDGLTIYVTRADYVTFTRGGSTLEYYTHCETVGDFVNELGLILEEGQEIVPSLDTPIENHTQIYVKSKVNAMSPYDFGIDISNARMITCEATAYTSAADECGKSDGITASGAMFEVGVVAVDPRVIPLGTKLYIESVDGKYVYGYCTALDTGGAIKGNKVDLAMNTKSECFQFGRRKVTVYILS